MYMGIYLYVLVFIFVGPLNTQVKFLRHSVKICPVKDLSLVKTNSSSFYLLLSSVVLVFLLFFHPTKKKLKTKTVTKIFILKKK